MKHLTKKPLYSALLLGLSSCFPAMADDVKELSTISVQGQVDTGPKISTDKLLSVAGSGGDPLKAIEALPGVVLSDDGSGEPAVRGSSPEDNYYQTDHMPVGYLFHTLGDSTYNPSTIENFSLKAGAWDSQYNNAIGAVLDTQLRDPYLEPIQTELDISFLRAGILIEGAVTENSAFFASWREGLLDWYIDHIDEPDEGIAITQVPKYNDYQFKYHYEVDAVSNFRFVALGARDALTVELGEKFEEANKEPGLVGRVNIDGYYDSQGFMYDTLLTGGSSSLWVFSHKAQDFEFEIGSLFDITMQSHDYRIKNILEMPLKNGDGLHLGIELKDNQFKYQGDGLYNPCNDDLESCDPASTGEPFTLGDSLSIRSSRLFSTYDYMLAGGHSISFGVNSLYNEFLKELSIEPRLNTRYYLNQNWTLTAAIGRHSQTPRDLFAIFKETGNQMLDMPKSEHFVAGFEFKLDDDLDMSLEAYYKNLHELIISNHQYDEELNATAHKYINGAQGHSYGLEFLLNKHLTDHWYGWLSVAYSKTKRKINTTGKTFNYSYDRPWVINLVANFEWSEKTTVGFKWRYQSGNLLTPILGGTAIYQCDSGFEEVNTGNGCGAEPYLYDPIEGEFNSERLPARHGLDMRLDYQKSEMTLFYFEIINAYSNLNVTEYEYSDDYSTKEGVSELETLFSLGVKLNF